MLPSLYFADGEGPRFHRPLREEWEIRNLEFVDPHDHLRYVIDAVSQIRKALSNEVPLIGFSGSPYTLACYMIEGRGGTDFHEIKRMLYARPDLLHTILDVNARSVIAYLNAQIEAGAQAVMIFDTWGGNLSSPAFHEFSLAYIKRICSELTRTRDGQTVPRIVFTKGGGQWLEALADSGADALGIDWSTDLGTARRRVGTQVALQGNMDPAILRTTPEVVEREVEQVLASFGQGSGHVFNLGHGVSQYTPPENVAALIDAVHAKSPHYH